MINMVTSQSLLLPPLSAGPHSCGLKKSFHLRGNQKIIPSLMWGETLETKGEKGSPVYRAMSLSCKPFTKGSDILISQSLGVNSESSEHFFHAWLNLLKNREIRELIGLKNNLNFPVKINSLVSINKVEPNPLTCSCLCRNSLDDGNSEISLTLTVFPTIRSWYFWHLF